MHVHFTNGTSRQKQWFHEAVDQSTYDFTQLDAVVSVSFVPNPGPPDPNEFAYTTGIYGDAHSTMQVKDDLDDPSRPGDEGGAVPGTYTGEAFYKETILHELGHVIINTLWQPGWQDAICDLFGAPHSAWNSGDWVDRVWEATTETFKDIFSTSANRKFLNRTNWYLPKDKLDTWLHYYTVHVPPAPPELGGTPGSNGFLPFMVDPKSMLVAWQVDPSGGGVVGPAPFRGIPGVSTVIDSRPDSTVAEPRALLVEVYRGVSGDTVAVLKYAPLEILSSTPNVIENYPGYQAWSEEQVNFDPDDDIQYVIEPGDGVFHPGGWDAVGQPRPRWGDYRLGHGWGRPVIMERVDNLVVRVTLPVPAHILQRILPVSGNPADPPLGDGPPNDPSNMDADPALDDPVPRGSYTGQWSPGVLEPRDSADTADFIEGAPTPTGGPSGVFTIQRVPIGSSHYPDITQYDYHYTFGWPSLADGGGYWNAGEIAGGSSEADPFTWKMLPDGRTSPRPLEHGVAIYGDWTHNVQLNHPGWPYVDLTQPDLGAYVRAGGGYAAAIRLDMQDEIAHLRTELLRGQR